MKGKSVAALFFFLFLAGWAGAVGAADWTLVDENDSSSYYYDKSSLQRPEVGKVRVLTRAVYTEEGKAEALKVLAHYTDMGGLYESRYLYDLDCLEEQSHLMGVTHLDKEGKTLRESNLGGVTKWEEILPDTRISVVFMDVCPE